MKPEELIKEVPEFLWLIEINGPVSRTRLFSTELGIYIKKIKVEKRTPQGWKGADVLWPSHTRVYSGKNYRFYGSEREACGALMGMMVNRRLELSHMLNNATSLINFINVEILNEKD